MTQIFIVLIRENLRHPRHPRAMKSFGIGNAFWELSKGQYSLKF